MVTLASFWSVPSWWLLVFIFVAKIIEKTIGTIRHIMVSKGLRKPAVILSLAEILMWVFIASKVFTDIAIYPLEGIAYALGFTVGIYVGSVIEEKLAFGKVLIQVITSSENGPLLTTKFREEGCGVTVIDAIGKTESRKVLLVIANRRGSKKLADDIKLMDPEAMIIHNEVGGVVGGYLSPIKSLLE